jgi:site-specific DNA-methyltransferase (adenine-specific)
VSERVILLCDDMRAALAAMPEASIDSCVTDPPYELGFMGRAWDSTGIAFDPEAWRAVLRVLKPGAHLVAFGGTRTWHRIACAIEDAGFEIRDSLAWMFGQGFPKSLDVSKAGAGIEWQGWGTALKPFFEPVILARKPLVGTVAATVIAHGTGAINVDGCRIGTDGGTRSTGEPNFKNNIFGRGMGGLAYESAGGRWPPNVLLDEEAARMLDEQSGAVGAAAPVLGTEPSAAVRRDGITNERARVPGSFHGDSGGASRFCYVAKADGNERDAGLEALPLVQRGDLVDRAEDSAGIQNPRAGAGRTSEGRRNLHPTVKPIDVMRWLCRLVTPPGGVVLDPFTGSGTTGVAAVVEGFRFHGIELDTAHAVIAWHRIDEWCRRALAPGATGKSAARSIRDGGANLDLFGDTSG